MVLPRSFAFFGMASATEVWAFAICSPVRSAGAASFATRIREMRRPGSLRDETASRAEWLDPMFGFEGKVAVLRGAHSVSLNPRGLFPPIQELTERQD